MKNLFNRLGLGLLALVLMAGIWGTHEWKADKPFSFRIFVDRIFINIALTSPQTLTSLGVLENLGIDGHNAHLDDASQAAGDVYFDAIIEAKRLLSQYQDEDLSEEQQLSKAVASFLFADIEQSKQFKFHNYPFSQFEGAQSSFPSFMDTLHRISDVQSAEHYIFRLSEANRFFTQMLEGMRIRDEKNIYPPKFVVQRVIDQMQDFVDTPVKENILYTSLATRMEKGDLISAEQQADLLQQAENEISSTVYPTYKMLIDYFVALKPKAGNNDGIWQLPQGDEVYKLAIRSSTTTDLTADEIHAIGLSEVDRIQAEVLTILASEGFDTSQGFTSAINELASQDTFYYPDTDEGREQILVDYQTILDEVDAELGDAFLVRPKAGMKVKRVPEFKEKTSSFAYYQVPSLDGSRPGVFYANLYDIKAKPKYSMRTLAYHEGIPGHHFQVAIAMELEGLPIFRTLGGFTAYIEGLALYAEYLAWELGYQNDPYDNIGRLQAELFRAVRLVVDTGIHDKRWTREESIEYMLNNTGNAESDVIAEIERYIVNPGQALAYKIGMMKILEVREKAKQALGDKFVLGEFHDVILRNGAVPLSIMETLVDKWIAEKGN
jgi:uncharacterized protein (DUF885 family)